MTLIHEMDEGGMGFERKTHFIQTRKVDIYLYPCGHDNGNLDQGYIYPCGQTNGDLDQGASFRLGLRTK